MTVRVRLAGILSLITVAAAWGTASGQELETETARTHPAGAAEAGVGVEYQTSADGTELATPMFGEIDLTDRLELMVEPVPLTAIHPNQGTSATGIGDVEVTLTGLALREQPHVPAIALAGEVKIPTARNELIGTREVDYAGYIIASKRFGALDVHLNVGYTILGQPPGTQVNNLYSFAAATYYQLNPQVDLFAEVLGNTAGTSEGGDSGSGSMATTAELTGGELVGTLGAGYRVTPSILLSLGLSYDNNNAVLIHPGITVYSQLF